MLSPLASIKRLACPMKVIRIVLSLCQDIRTTSSIIVTISPPPMLREPIGEGNVQSGLGACYVGLRFLPPHPEGLRHSLVACREAPVRHSASLPPSASPGRDERSGGAARHPARGVCSTLGLAARTLLPPDGSRDASRRTAARDGGAAGRTRGTGSP